MCFRQAVFDYYIFSTLNSHSFFSFINLKHLVSVIYIQNVHKRTHAKHILSAIYPFILYESLVEWSKQVWTQSFKSNFRLTIACDIESTAKFPLFGLSNLYWPRRAANILIINLNSKNKTESIRESKRFGKARNNDSLQFKVCVNRKTEDHIIKPKFSNQPLRCLNLDMNEKKNDFFNPPTF